LSIESWIATNTVTALNSDLRSRNALSIESWIATKQLLGISSGNGGAEMLCPLKVGLRLLFWVAVQLQSGAEMLCPLKVGLRLGIGLLFHEELSVQKCFVHWKLDCDKWGKALLMFKYLAEMLCPLKVGLRHSSVVWIIQRGKAEMLCPLKVGLRLSCKNTGCNTQYVQKCFVHWKLDCDLLGRTHPTLPLCAEMLCPLKVGLRPVTSFTT